MPFTFNFMNLLTYCFQQREKEAAMQKSLMTYALIGSAFFHASVALGASLLWRQTPELAEEPIEVIMVDAPKPEAKPPEPKPKEIEPPKPKPEPIPETKLVQKSAPPAPIRQPEPKRQPAPQPTVQATAPKPEPQPLLEKPKIEPRPQPRATNPEPIPQKPATVAPSQKPQPIDDLENVLTRADSSATPTPAKMPTSPENVAINRKAPSRQPVASPPTQPSGDRPKQWQDSFESHPSVNPEASEESAASTSPGNVAINQAPPQKTDREEPIQERSGGGVRCVSNCKPDYPSDIQEKIEGRPVVRILISEDGEVVESQLAKTSGHSPLDQAAIAGARDMIFEPPGAKVAVRVAINFTLEDSDFHREALERERQAQQERERKEKERQAQLERDRQEKARQAQTATRTTTSTNLQRERERIQQQRQQKIEQESRQLRQQRQQQMERQIPGQENQPQQPPHRLPSVFDEIP
ncbi:MAG: TonB family protein [Hydrococcus sp. RM1_1_31]|nr:TonB family protein [Hydrococcus sp. RM1_1_31]